MSENFTNESKKNWTRIFRKKWFFPTLYLAIAALLVAGVIWYQDFERKLSESLEDVGKSDNYIPNPFDEEAEPVSQEKEIIKMPYQDEIQTEIVTKFYDFTDELEEKEKALNYYNERYYQSTGIDVVASDGETFDVLAALSGTVTEIKEDPLNGNVIVLSHGDEISTYYSSLSQVDVSEGDEIAQGEIIGLAGKNLFGKESGTHLHFELWKGDTEVNPEEFFNESISKLEQLDVPEEDDGDDTNDEEDNEEDDDSKDEDSPEKEELE